MSKSKPKFRVGQIVGIVSHANVFGKVTVWLGPVLKRYQVRHCPFNSRGDITEWAEMELRSLTKREAGR